MRFPQFTAQALTIEGSWQGDERQFRFSGIISSSTPFVILSLLQCGDESHYTKHNKSNALEVPIALHQGKFPHDNRYQHTLLIGNTANTGAISEGPLLLTDDLPVTFHAGRLFTLATDFQNQPFIYLMAIAKVDIKSKRCGIWAVKPGLLDGLDEPWRHVLSKTRHGFINIP